MEPAKLAIWAGVITAVGVLVSGMWAFVNDRAEHRADHREVTRRIVDLEKSRDVMVDVILRHRENHPPLAAGPIPPPRADRDHMTKFPSVDLQPGRHLPTLD